MAIDTNKSHKVCGQTVVDNLSKKDGEVIQTIVDLLREFEDIDRINILMLIIDNATRSHDEDISLGISLLVSKIAGHFKCDGKILTSVISAITQSVVEAEKSIGGESSIFDET